MKYLSLIFALSLTAAAQEPQAHYQVFPAFGGSGVTTSIRLTNGSFENAQFLIIEPGHIAPLGFMLPPGETYDIPEYHHPGDPNSLHGVYALYIWSECMSPCELWNVKAQVVAHGAGWSETLPVLQFPMWSGPIPMAHNIVFPADPALDANVIVIGPHSGIVCHDSSGYKYLTIPAQPDPTLTGRKYDVQRYAAYCLVYPPAAGLASFAWGEVRGDYGVKVVE